MLFVNPVVGGKAGNENAAGNEEGEEQRSRRKG